MRTDAAKTIEDRIRAIEDRLEIYNLIASHPPSADTGAQSYVQSIYTEDGVLDLGSAKRADGNQAVSQIVARPEHGQAIKGGLAHFAGLPHVTIDGDRAVVTSYLQILAPHPTADEIEVPAHGATRGYRIDLPATARPITIFGGAEDEMMISDKYAEAVQSIKPSIDVKIIDGINHMGIVTQPKAISVIAEDVATRGAGQS